MRSFKILVLTAMTAGCLLTPAFALADAAQTGAKQFVVSTTDLDLSTAAGQAALTHRVRRAAGEVCGSPAGETDRLEAHVRFNACVKAAADKALAAAASQVATNR